MVKHICSSDYDTVEIDGTEYTVDHLRKTIKNYQGVLKRVNKYQKQKKIREKAELDAKK